MVLTHEYQDGSIKILPTRNTKIRGKGILMFNDRSINIKVVIWRRMHRYSSEGKIVCMDDN